jgi:phage shock protein A
MLHQSTEGLALIFHKIGLAVSSLQDKLEERETDPRLELVEEKLRLAESELQLAVQRAEQAEKRAMQLNSKGDACLVRVR